VNRGVQNDTRVRGPFSQAPVHVTIPVNTAREHGYLCIEHRVHGPCWQKALHDNNAFCQNDTHVPSLTGAVVHFLPDVAYTSNVYVNTLVLCGDLINHYKTNKNASMQ